MPRPSTNPLEVCTRALRLRSLPILSEGLGAYLRSNEPVQDARDVMVGLAPFHDCVRRLGADPAIMFDEAARGLVPELAEIARTFGRRSDVTPRAFGYAVEVQADGPMYRWGPVGSN